MHGSLAGESFGVNPDAKIARQTIFIILQQLKGNDDQRTRGNQENGKSTKTCQLGKEMLELKSIMSERFTSRCK